MNAYHNEPEFKTAMLEAAEAHRKADEYISGTYGSLTKGHFKGCSVGCSLFDVQQIRGIDLDSYEDHETLADALGVPEWFTRLQDTLFEGVTAERRPKLTGELLSAIPVGFDGWEPAEHKLHIFIQQENRKRVDVLQIEAALKKQVLDAIDGTIDVRQKALVLGWDESAAWSAESAARSAASSARSAESAAWWSAESAARSAASSARSAESAAWWSARSAAAEAAAYESIADKLIELLGEE